MNYNFLDKNAYDQNADPFAIVDKVEVLKEVSQDAQRTTDLNNTEDINMPDYVKKKISCQEMDFMTQFRQGYDLNVLYSRHQKQQKIDRQTLDLKDAKMLQLFLLQLKQFLLMMQASGLDRALEAV